MHVLFISPSVFFLSAFFAVSIMALTIESFPNIKRMKKIEKMLTEYPVTPGRPLFDRYAWRRFGASPAYPSILQTAQNLLLEPLPKQSDELYLEYSRTGNRSHYENLEFGRRNRLAPLVLAECVENKGTFLPAIEALVVDLCSEKSWVLPAHDGSLDNFYDKVVDIDLFSSALGWEILLMRELLYWKLPSHLLMLIRKNILHRILNPFQNMILEFRPANWWLTSTNNWNAVCLAGITGASLLFYDSPDRRAVIVAAAEKYIRFFLSGFTPDGYCSEGLGYWNYGYGNFLYLSETVCQATHGKLDFMAMPEAYAPATFAARMEIMNGVYPAFADCAVMQKPSQHLMWYLNRRFQFNIYSYAELDKINPRGSLRDTLLFDFPNSVTRKRNNKNAGLDIGVRSWFENAGVLITRPMKGSACRMGVAMKGGNNAEHHNHNDIGSFTVVVNDRPVLLDPGAETYTARTFGAHRYDSMLLSSYGHPVPVIGGGLQHAGAAAKAVILHTEFTEDNDMLEMDIRSAYAAPELISLLRTFMYSRAGDGYLEVTDRLESSSPLTFEMGLVTLGQWDKLEDGILLFSDHGQQVKVEIDAQGHLFDIISEAIHDNLNVTPVRVGIRLRQSVTSLVFTLRIAPSMGL